MQVYQVENLEIKCRVSGRGAKVLLLHGFGGGPSDWNEVVQTLEGHCQVFVPNLSVFYTQQVPLSYEQQVLFLKQLLLSITGSGEPIHVVGSSYGGTLSFGLRILCGQQFKSHTMINPMPFHPIKNLKHWELKLILLLSRLPGVLRFYAKTSLGIKTFSSLGQLFQMGIRGNHKIQRFNHRKLLLIRKALKRFIWIDKNEKWSKWKQHFVKDGVYSSLIYSDKDEIFSRDRFLRFARQLDKVNLQALPYVGHSVIKTHPKWISDILLECFGKSESSHSIRYVKEDISA